MLERLRGLMARLLTPTARTLLRFGVTPDAVTWAGTVVVVAVALIMVPLGLLWPAALIIGAASMSDMLDGQMARLSGVTSRWGAFLDSTLDRVGDGAVFGAVVVWFALADDHLGAALGLVALVMGQVTSYVKARAESQGWTITGGLAARADRLFLLLLAMLLQGLGVPYALIIATGLLALASTITVVQRMLQAHRQSAEDRR
ncbi:phosphatidylinositol phosphate synthase [Propionibacteriaceae bacterium Y1685]|uniref:phosphatidylinositol phosphate synthase n=1 Tax=Microlunatus sp. Y1700 TaxID=3418487 RepID=UPI003B7D8F56